jgi:hypothetical protein
MTDDASVAEWVAKLLELDEAIFLDGISSDYGEG